MPYHLKRKGELYFVVDDEGKKYSHSGLSKQMAKKQMIALNIAHARKAGYDIPMKKDPVKPDPVVLKAPECAEPCTTNKLKGNLVVFNDSLSKLFMSKKLVEQSLPTLSVVPGMRALPILTQEAGFSIGVAPVKKVEGFETKAENVLVQPKKAGRPVKRVTEDLAMALSSNKMTIKEAAISGMSETDWKGISGNRRKGVYETIRERGIEPPRFVSTGYERWLKKQK